MRTSVLTAVLLGVGYLLFCIHTLSHQYTFDAISYLLDVENTHLSIPLNHESIAYNFFHSQHLLFSFFIYVFYHCWQAFGYTGTSLLPAQILNLFEGSLALSLVCWTIQSITEDWLLALGSSLMLGFTYAFWSNTAMVSDHMASCLFAVVLFYSILKTDFANVSTKRIMFLGFLNGLATLMHEVNAILGIMFLVAFAYSQLHYSSRLKSLFVYTLTAALTVAIPYVLVGVFILGNTTFHDFMFWCFYYAMPGVIEVTGHYGTFSAAKLVDLAAGIGGAIVGGFYWMNRIFEMRTLQLYGVPALSISALIAFLFVIARIFTVKIQNGIQDIYRKTLRLSASWFVVYALLLFWWWPSYYQLWAVPLSGLAFFWGTYIHKRITNPISNYPPLYIGFAAVVLFVCTANAIAAFVPAHDIRNNDYYTTTMAIGKQTQNGDVIVIPGNDEYEIYIPYFVKRNTISLHEKLVEYMNDTKETFDNIEETMNQTWDTGHHVFIVSELRDSANVYADVYSLHHLKNDDVAQFFRRYAVSDTLDAGSLTLYKIEPLEQQ